MAGGAPAGGGSALEAVLRVWTERQGELRGHFEIKLAATALLRLLATCHPALGRVQARAPPRARGRTAAACGLQPEASPDPARRSLCRAVPLYGRLAMTCGGTRPPVKGRRLDT